MSSGYNLRALLENEKLYSTLANFAGNNNCDIDGKALCGDQPKNSHGSVAPIINPGAASLQLLDNPWQNHGQDDFDLEYMDLDEFLTETGLVDTVFSDIPAPTRSPDTPNHCVQSPTSCASPSDVNSNGIQGNVEQVCSSQSSLERLLMGDSPSPVLASVPYAPATPITREDGSPRVTTPTSLTDSSPQTVTVNEVSLPSMKEEETTSVPKAGTKADTSCDVVMKRKYSDDGEGLTATSVMVVPGRDGFNPAEAKFAPEDLQPQPIIRKSRKQFVAEDNKDEKYWKRRNQNNVAAKRSREARRAKENQIIMRAGFLESENSRLTEENSKLLAENKHLQELVRKLEGSASG